MDMMGSIFTNFAEALKDVLPISPFKDFIAQFGGLPYLGWLNWFFPVRGCLTVLGIWLTAVATFYIWSIVMRWLKVIGD